MRIKTFNLHFYCDDSTRWLHDDAELSSVIAVLARSAGVAHTAGPMPAVRVSVETVKLVPSLHEQELGLSAVTFFRH